MERVRDVVMQIQPNDSPERFRGLGVDVIRARASSCRPTHSRWPAARLTSRSFVIATGSRPAVPDVPGLNSVPYLTNETVFDLREPVPSFIVVGSGPIGSELAQAFRRLGSEVTVLDVRIATVAARRSRRRRSVVHAQFVAEGIGLRLDAKLMSASKDNPGTSTCHAGRLSHGRGVRCAARTPAPRTGRKLNVEHLGLDAAGVGPAGRSHRGRRPASARRSRTSTSQATLPAARNSRTSRSITPASCCATRSSACGGPGRRGCRGARIPIRSWRASVCPRARRRSEASRTACTGFPSRRSTARVPRVKSKGFAKLLTDPKGKILGATIVGCACRRAHRRIVLALAQGLPRSTCPAAIHTYPTLASISRRVADQRLKEGLTPTAKAWIRRIFRLRGVLMSAPGRPGHPREGATCDYDCSLSGGKARSAKGALK